MQLESRPTVLISTQLNIVHDRSKQFPSHTFSFVLNHFNALKRNVRIVFEKLRGYLVLGDRLRTRIWTHHMITNFNTPNRLQTHQCSSLRHTVPQWSIMTNVSNISSTISKVTRTQWCKNRLTDWIVYTMVEPVKHQMWTLRTNSM